MKRLLLVAVLVLGFAGRSYADNASNVAQQVTVDLQKSGAITAQDALIVTSSVKTLVENGATVSEAKTVVSQAVKQARANSGGIPGEFRGQPL